MSAVKALQQWCRVQCQGYQDVNITNMTTSFRDGLAFCALIHKHRPDIINFDSLKKENVYDNNKLAFRVAEEELGIPALLDAEDMVALKIPDRLSILTYVSQYYNYFHGRSPIGGMGGIKRPAESPSDERTGKKNQPVVSQVFPPAKSARENSPPPSSNITRPTASPRQIKNTIQGVPVDTPHQTGTLSGKCVSCNMHVHLVQRHLVDGKLYHRSCARILSPTNTTKPLRELPTNTSVSKFPAVQIKPDSRRTNTNSPTPTPSRLGPAWLTERSRPPPKVTATSTPSSPALQRVRSPSPAAKDSQSISTFSPLSPASRPARTPSPAAKDSQSVSTFSPSSPASRPARTSSPAAKDSQSVSTFTSLSPASRPARTSSPAAKDSQSVSTFTSLSPASRPARTSSPAAKDSQSVSTFTSLSPASRPAQSSSSVAKDIKLVSTSSSSPVSRPAQSSSSVAKDIKLVSTSSSSSPVLRHAQSSSPAAKDIKLVSISSSSSPLLRHAQSSSPAAKDIKLVSISSSSSPLLRHAQSSSPAAKDIKLVSISSSSSPLLRPAQSLSPAAKDSQFVSKPTPSGSTGEPTFTTTTSNITRPTAPPRSSNVATRTMEERLKFFQSDITTNRAEKKVPTDGIDLKKGPTVTGKVQQAILGQAVTFVVNAAGTGRKEANMSSNTGEENSKAGDPGKMNDISKTKAAAFISKVLADESNNNRPESTTAMLKKTEIPSHVETPKRQTDAVRGRVKLRVDPSLLADLRTPHTVNSSPSPDGRTGLRARTPDKNASNPGSAALNAPAEEHEFPAEWRSKLKPVSKETKPAGPSLPSSKPLSIGTGASQPAKPSVGPSPSAHLLKPSISVTPPASTGFLKGQGDQPGNGTKYELKVTKTKPDFIHKEDIVKELQEIENNLNELENRGVELEMRLRRSEEGEEDGEDDSLMVEWFNLIRNKQVAMRRESELVYIGRTQDLEEQQPNVEQELRTLMEKPENLKTNWDRKREEKLMTKLVAIVNDRNAIIEGLDDDRLREEEEDEQLNKMLKNLNIKKDAPAKKSPMSRLFNWGNKKEG